MIEIRDELIARIARMAEIPAASVKEDVPLRDQGVDSLMAMELVAFIEKRLGIEIPEGDIPKVRTLNDILDKVRQYAGEK
ncbi:MAG TPA: acyl carrier protein [Candidatus Dormibacteraeota bacterium]|nr:acyl carrier protein [Candidatus Dormibacteraeota bacterium]